MSTIAIIAQTVTLVLGISINGAAPKPHTVKAKDMEHCKQMALETNALTQVSGKFEIIYVQCVIRQTKQDEIAMIGTKPPKSSKPSKQTN